MYTLLVETVPSVTKRRIDLQAETLSDFRAKLLAETRVPDTGDNVQLEYFDADFGEYALLTYSILRMTPAVSLGSFSR